MKKIVVLFLAIGVALVSCKDGKKKDKHDHKDHNHNHKHHADNHSHKDHHQSLEDGTYVVDVQGSVLKWKGFKPTGSHDGTLSVSNGSMEVKGGKIAGGNFTIDMKSIKVLDIPADDKYNAKLVGHLKDKDFFDVDKHKTASFKITSFDKGVVEGVLTIKGISKPIKFNASATNDNGVLHFSSKKITFDRTDYGIKYKSKKFFESLKDKFINDEIEVSFDVKAKK